MSRLNGDIELERSFDPPARIQVASPRGPCLVCDETTRVVQMARGSLVMIDRKGIDTVFAPGAWESWRREEE